MSKRQKRNKPKKVYRANVEQRNQAIETLRSGITVNTEDLDGNPVSYDPLALGTAISKGALHHEPDAELVAAALVVSWVQTLDKEQIMKSFGAALDDTQTAEEFLEWVYALDGEDDLKEWIAWSKQDADIDGVTPTEGQHR